MLQIRVAANIEIIQIRVAIMFTKFICQNDCRPLSTFIRGVVGERLKRLSREQEIPGSNPCSA